MKPMNGTTLIAHQIGTLERPRYFPRQLITPVEMTLEQDYFKDKLRRHNRLLHGWGVVCGAEVCTVRSTADNGWEPWKVRVQPGYILGPFGDEILIAKEQVISLQVPITAGGPEALNNEISDAWCRPVYRESLPEWVYVAVRYHERQTRQVRAQPAGCGCDDSSCEYSRICDGYDFGVLPSCPPSHQSPQQFPDLGALLTLGTEACLETPEEEWVVLAAVRLEQNGRILAIDNCSCRRMVASFAAVWSRCTGGGLQVAAVKPDEMQQGEQYDVVISGSNFQPDTTIDVRPWAKIENLSFTNSSEIRFHIYIAIDAPPGRQTFMIMNPDCSLVVTSVLIVEPPANDDAAKASEKEKKRRDKRR